MWSCNPPKQKSFFFLIIFFCFQINTILSQKCEIQLQALLTGIDTNVDWALRMRDAWGIQAPGLYSGNKFDLGNFPQCYYFNYFDTQTNMGWIQGQNCMVPVKNKLNQKFSASICIPATCSPAEIKPLLQGYLKDRLNLSIERDLAPLDCERRPIYKHYSPLFWSAVIFFTIYIALVILATIYERFYYLRSKCGKILIHLPIVNAFALYPNFVNVLNVEKNTRKSNIECLDGLRAISIMCVVYAHTYFIQLDTPLMNNDYIYEVRFFLFFF